MPFILDKSSKCLYKYALIFLHQICCAGFLSVLDYLRRDFYLDRFGVLQSDNMEYGI